jgi:peptide deformylase
MSERLSQRQPELPPFLSENDLRLRQRARRVSLEELHAPEVTQSLLDLVYVAGLHATFGPDKPILMGLHSVQVTRTPQAIDALLIDWNARKWPDGKPPGYTPHHRLLLNTTITDASAEQDEHNEGCFSLPLDLRGRVQRAAEVTFSGWEIDISTLLDSEIAKVSVVHETTTDPFQARILAHETEHGKGQRYAALLTDPRKLDQISDETRLDYRKNWKTWTNHPSPERFLELQKLSRPTVS